MNYIPYDKCYSGRGVREADPESTDPWVPPW